MSNFTVCAALFIDCNIPNFFILDIHENRVFGCSNEVKFFGTFLNGLIKVNTSIAKLKKKPFNLFRFKNDSFRVNCKKKRERTY